MFRKSAFRIPHSAFLDPRSSNLYNPRFPVRHQNQTFNIKGEPMASISFKGNPVTLAGADVKEGQDAPDFRLQKVDMSDYTLESGAGKTRIIAAVPSLDTPVCDAETRRFNEEAAKLPNVEIICVSMDLPFAMKRWCGAAGVDKVTAASDHRDASFGSNYGVLIQGGPLDRLHARAVFVIDPNNKVKYAEYVSDIAEHPNYAAVLAAAQ
jgi:thioredoxin-dependent peroxiredoxin